MSAQGSPWRVSAVPPIAPPSPSRRHIFSAVCWSTTAAVALFGCQTAKPVAISADIRAVDGGSADAKADAGSCPAIAQLPTGECCPTGQVVADGKQCQGVGPPECGATIVGAPHLCLPKWCSSWVDTKGQACNAGQAGCTIAGHPCSDAELTAATGCPVGERPTATQGCASWAEPLPTATTSALAAPVAPGSAVPPRWCTDAATAAPRDCTAAEKGCVVGQEPDPAAPGACRVQLGTSLVCPPGFVANPAAVSGELDECTPDLADCGTQTFDVGTAGGAVAYVDASFGGTGSGTSSSPFAKIGDAIAAVAVGGTVAIAAGTYTESVVVSKPVHLRGRCAALVKISAPAKGTTVLQFSGAAIGATARGLWLSGGYFGVGASKVTAVEIERIHVTKAAGNGLRIDNGAQVQVRDAVVAHVANVAAGTLVTGEGVLVTGKNSQLKAERLRVTRSGSRGVMVEQGGMLTATDLVVDLTSAPIAGTKALDSDGTGITAFGGTVELRRVRLRHNQRYGLLAVGAQSKLSATFAAVEDTLPEPINGAKGIGVACTDGASVALHAARVTGNRYYGVFAKGQGTQVTLNHTQLASTRVSAIAEYYYSPGLTALEDANVKAHGLFVVDNQTIGVLIALGAHLDADHVLVSDTRPLESEEAYNSAIQVSDSGTMNLRHARLSHNSEVGLIVLNEGTTVRVEHLVVDGTVAPAAAPDLFGSAIQVRNGAVLHLHDVRLHNNEAVALAASHTGSTVTVSDLLVDATRPNQATQDYGLGVVIQSGAQATLHGARVTAHRGAAVIGDGAGTRITAYGLVVDATAPRATDAGGGHAVYAAHAAVVELNGCLIANNRSTGLAADHASLNADRCVVRNTLFAKLVDPDKRVATVDLGDGLLAVAATTFAIRRSVIVDNQRSNILIDSTKGAKITQTLVTRSLYGVVLQHGATLDAQGNAVYGHELGNRSGDAGLSVPGPPLLVVP